jgi:hypothetical protein
VPARVRGRRLVRAAVLALAGGFAAAAGAAQEAAADARFEAGVFAGGYFGTRVFLDDRTDIRVGRSALYGLRFAFDVRRNFALELSFARAAARLEARDPVTGASLGPRAPIDVNSFGLDGVFPLSRSRSHVYFAVGLGATTLHPFVPGVAGEAGTRFAASVALGGKVFFTDALGVRLEGRYRWRETDRRTGAVVCGDLGCFGFTTNLYSSGELTGGLAYRFGGRRAPPGDLVAGAGRATDAGLSPPAGSAEAAAPSRFLPGAGEIVLLELLPWAFDRYVDDQDFARISLATVSDNFATGFTYDRDDFATNQSSHPYHGSLYFGAARSNGYGYWQSGIFALAGSFLWECCMENGPPAINDLVNTTLGGMTRGEISHRLATMIRDNTASGGERVWREIGAAFLDPVGAFSRLLRGELGRGFANPADRFPASVAVDTEVGYRHLAGGASHPNQGILSISVLYGDPFAGEIHNPFDAFSAAIDLNHPGDTLVSRIEERGILKAWELTPRDATVRHVVGFSQEYEYLNNASQIFGAQIFSAGLLSRYTLRPGLDAVTDASAIAFPLAGIQTTDAENPTTGRNFDYAPGGGFRVAARLYGAGREIFAAGYGVAWARTTNGSSTNNVLQFFRASARVPITRALGVGGRYSWYSRQTTYTGFFEGRRTQSEWRVFVDLAFARGLRS